MATFPAGPRAVSGSPGSGNTDSCAGVGTGNLGGARACSPPVAPPNAQTIFFGRVHTAGLGSPDWPCGAGESNSPSGAVTGMMWEWLRFLALAAGLGLSNE